MPSAKGKSRRVLLRGSYFNVPAPWGVVRANCEVWLHVQVRVDQEDNDASSWDQSGGDDVPGVLEQIADRIAGLVESATPAAAPLERIAQIELFEGLDPSGGHK